MFTILTHTLRSMSASRRRPARPRKQRLALETLEGRQLMSVWGEFAVNSTTNYDQYDSDNACSANGMAVAVWVHTYSPTDTDIHAQLYNASGAPIGPEIVVDDSSARESEPAVAMDSQGNFVVTWTRAYSSGNWDVLARRYNASGVAVTDRFFVTSSSRREYSPDVAMAADGRFAISYTLDYSASDQDVFVQPFTSAGGYLPVITVANSWKNERYSSIAMAPDGRFDVAYELQFDGSDLDIWANRYSAAGALLGSHPIATSSVFEGAPSIAMNDYGDAVVAYEASVNGVHDIKARWLYSWGYMGNEINITNTPNSSELYPSVALSHNDNLFVVAYQGYVSGGVTHSYLAEVYGTSVSLTTDLGADRRAPAVSIDGNGYYFITCTAYKRYSYDITGRFGHM